MTLIINSKRCYLRSLDLKDDLSKYLYWMQTPANNPFILSAKLDFGLNQLKEFIANCNIRHDIMLLGIFTNINDVHIGNIKSADIDLVNKSAWLGILIGDKDYRGKGIVREIIVTSILWISQKYKIKSIKLGVDPNNIIACRLYQKMGFEIIERSLSGGYVMEIKTDNLNEI